MRPAPAIWILLGVGTFLGALGARVFAAGVRAAILGWLSPRWPVARGRVTESRVVETSRGARLLVHYAYQVDGVAYAGDTFGFAARGSRWVSTPRRDEIRASALRYAAGSEIQVSYWPARASVSVLEPGFHWGSVMLIAVGGAWLGIGAILCGLAFLRYA